MFRPAITLDAALPLRIGLARLDLYSDEADVILRRTDDDLTVYWYRMRVADIRQAAVRRGPGALDQTLRAVLQLHEGGACDSFEAESTSRDELDNRWGVLIDGNQALGVLDPSPPPATANGGTRGGDPPRVPPGPLPPPPAPAPPVAGGLPQTPQELFSAFPDLAAPRRVEPGALFDLVIGLASQPSAEVVGTAITLAVAADVAAFDLDLQVIAPDFDMPEGGRRVLHVVRADPAKNKVSVRLIAPPIPGPVQPFFIEVQFSSGGEPVGRAWREIVVAQAGVFVPEKPLALGGTPVDPAGSGAPADLTVTISANREGGVLVVDFDSPHTGVSWPDDRAEREIVLGEDDARTFALRQIRTLADTSHLTATATGPSLTAERLRGLGRIIAEKLPFAFWRVVEQVWQAVQAADPEAVPTLLLVSADPHIPWELASTDEDFVDPALGLVDPARPPFLAAQWQVGRWLPPGPRSLRGTVPGLPPAAEVPVSHLALAIGDYLAINGHRPLPQALAEGQALAERYGAAVIALGATGVDIERLAHGALQTAAGQPITPDAIHFACHGEVDPDNPQHNGIILSDSGDYLSPAVVRGSKLGRAGAPFVFLNACQAGQASEPTIADYGGLAGAFLAEGCRGFVAPLWSVDDDDANAIALRFYAEALDSGRAVAAVLRDLRAGFDADANQPADTFLAYIFYGHPRLVLRRRF